MRADPLCWPAGALPCVYTQCHLRNGYTREQMLGMYGSQTHHVFAQVCIHECSICAGADGLNAPPIFRIVAADRPEEPLIGKSATGAGLAAGI